MLTTQSVLTRRSTKLWRLAVPILLAMGLAGCFRAETSIDVNEDGSGTVGFLVAMDMETMEAIARGFEDIEGAEEDDDLEFEMEENPFLEDFEDADLPPGTTVEPYEEDGLVGVWVRVPFQSEGDATRTLTDLFEVVGDDDVVEDDGFESFRLERDGDLWLFEAEFASGDDDFAFEDPAEAAFLQAFFPDEPYTFSIKLPGGVIDHNADRVADDGTLTWVIDIFSPETRHMSATSDSTAAPTGAQPPETTEAPDTTEAVVDTTEAPEDDDPVDAADEASAPVDDDGGLSPLLIAAIVAVALAAVVGITLAVRRSNPTDIE